jgi:hypothetical protein
MGIFDFLFGKTPKIIHPFFGEIVSLTDEDDPTDKLYECKRKFKPTGDDVQLVIGGDETGPTQKEVDFFQSIELKYPQIINSVITFLENQFIKNEIEFKRIDFQKEYRLVCMRISGCDKDPVFWDIEFENVQQGLPPLEIEMKGFEAMEDDDFDE